MTLLEFGQMNFLQQSLLLPQAVYMGKCEEGNYTALLYRLDSFYIEVRKHKKYQHIYQVEAFDNPERLIPYISEIDYKLT